MANTSTLVSSYSRLVILETSQGTTDRKFRCTLHSNINFSIIYVLLRFQTLLFLSMSSALPPFLFVSMTCDGITWSTIVVLAHYKAKMVELSLVVVRGYCLWSLLIDCLLVLLRVVVQYNVSEIFVLRTPSPASDTLVTPW